MAKRKAKQKPVKLTGKPVTAKEVAKNKGLSRFNQKKIEKQVNKILRKIDRNSKSS